MTTNLMITSINPGVGKTTFTFALILKLRSMGMNVGYFKPISDSPEDTDAQDAKNLLEMPQELSNICPLMISSYEYDMLEEQKEKKLLQIRAAYNLMCKSYDFLIIESCRRINYLAFLELSTRELAGFLDASVLILTQGREVEDTDRIVLGINYFKDIDIVGTIFSLVPDQLINHFKTVIVPILERKFSIDVLGIIPDRGSLSAPTVSEVASTLGARCVAAEEYTSRLVETHVVGAMNPEAALKYFRRSVNKAVITGGDRPQLALAAMETSTSCLILTGGILPPARVLSTAEEKGIPVLLVNSDTYSTIKQLTSQPIYGKIHIDQEEKIDSWSKILEQVEMNKLVEKLRS